MTYVISDLHGYPLEKLKALLAKANFSDSDFLYILGDVIDRNNDGGVDILNWLLTMPNAQLILGNHEAMLLGCRPWFVNISDESIAALDTEKINILQEYQLNGGDVTLNALYNLKKTSPGAINDIFYYLLDAPFYEAISIGDKDFFLCHSGIDNFEKGKKISSYPSDSFIWTWPELTDEYFDDVITVFGHTPTLSYGDEYKNKIIKTRTWIDIDMGAADGVTEPVLLRLDDMKEFRN